MTGHPVDAIVTDIEGTTSSIAFVKDVLFPYARQRLAAFIAQHPAEAAPILAEVRDLEHNPSLTNQQIAALLAQWIDEDRKATPLKALQGLIWAEGYASGELQGHMYEDAVRALRAWHARGIPLYVYSSGSVAAQKLIYGHTAWGDLTPLFSGYFDTRIGGKLEADSYRRIAAEIGKPPARLLFLSDHAGEIAAAHEAGWRTQTIDRDGRAPGVVATFDAIEIAP
jgi:enolase-phosphatase E1